MSWSLAWGLWIALYHLPIYIPPMVPAWYLLGDPRYQLNSMKERKEAGKEEAQARWLDGEGCPCLPTSFNKALFTPFPFPWCPQMVGSGRKKDYQEAWERKCLFIGAGVVPVGDEPQAPLWDPRPQLLPPAGDTLSQGNLFYQLLQKEREDDDARSLGLRHRPERGLLESRVRGKAGGEALPVTSGRGRWGCPPQAVPGGACAGSGQQLSSAPRFHTGWLGPVNGH